MRKLENNPKPNQTYNNTARTTFWHSDELGRTKKVEFKLSRLVQGKRSNYQQGKANKNGINRPVEVYEGGHLLGDRFGYDALAINLVPMIKSLNQGNYKLIENFWHSELDKGQKITNGVIKIKYFGSSRCPAFIEVSYKINHINYKHNLVNDSAFNCWGERDITEAFK